MTRKEQYETVIMFHYECTKETIELLDDDELKLRMFSDCLISFRVILLSGLKDELLSPSEFYYLGLKINELSDKLLEYFDSEYIFIKG